MKLTTRFLLVAIFISATTLASSAEPKPKNYCTIINSTNKLIRILVTYESDQYESFTSQTFFPHKTALLPNLSTIETIRTITAQRTLFDYTPDTPRIPFPDPKWGKTFEITALNEELVVTEKIDEDLWDKLYKLFS